MHVFTQATCVRRVQCVQRPAGRLPRESVVGGAARPGREYKLRRPSGPHSVVGELVPPRRRRSEITMCGAACACACVRDSACGFSCVHAAHTSSCEMSATPRLIQWLTLCAGPTGSFTVMMRFVL